MRIKIDNPLVRVVYNKEVIMFPTGSFDRMKSDVINRYEEYDIPLTVGILIADARQADVKQYVLNYLKRFDKNSGQTFDFFIPGYINNNSAGSIKLDFSKEGQQFYFSYEKYEEFLNQIEVRMGVMLNNQPTLILAEFKKGVFGNMMIIELNDQNISVKNKSYDLFMRIFEISKKHVDINKFRDKLRSTYIVGGLVNLLKTELEKKLIVRIGTEVSRNYTKFKFR